MSDAAFFAGVVSSGQSKTNRLLEEQNKLLKGGLRDEIIQELIEEGTILPPYDWGDPQLVERREAIVNEFYERHKDMKIGDGQFAKRFPEKDKAIDAVDALANNGRLTPDEYLQLLAALFA